MPREGHMRELLKIFAYLRSKHKLTLYFDSGLPNINYGDFVDNAKDFSEIYPNVNEDMPIDMPEPRGRPVITSGYAMLHLHPIVKQDVHIRDTSYLSIRHLSYGTLRNNLR